MVLLVGLEIFAVIWRHRVSSNDKDGAMQSQDQPGQQPPTQCDQCGSPVYKTMSTRTHDRYLCLATSRHVMYVEKQQGRRIPVQGPPREAA